MKLEKKQILIDLVKIAKMGGSHRDPFICCDTVYQENLFDIQEALGELLLKIAKDVRCEEFLVEQMPYAFKKA